MTDRDVTVTTIEVTVEKGEGRSGLVDAIDVALVVGSVRIGPGTYRITLERERKEPLPEGEL